MSAVHRHEVQVHVNDEIGFDRFAIELHLFAELGLADEFHPVRIFGVVVVEAVAPVRFEDATADDVTDFVRGHAAMDARRDDDVEVVDAVIGEHLEDDREDALADVGAAHRRERERDVVDRDDDAHPGLELRVERLGVVRVVDGVTNRGVDVFERIERRARVEHARAGGKI